MAKVCKRCNKQVYHAEEQISDGMVFHMGCFSLWKKEKDAADLGKRNVAYEQPADVQPSYYRTGDGARGAHMESGTDYKGGSSPRSAPAAAASADAKFCTSCGGKIDNLSAKFCGSCGKKL